MTWTGDKWPGPYGHGPYGPDWTAIEERELAPFHAALIDARKRAAWLNDPDAVAERIPEAMASEWQGLGLEFIESFLNPLSQAKADLKATKNRLRPERCKRDGSPYQAAHMRCTRPKNDFVQLEAN